MKYQFIISFIAMAFLWFGVSENSEEGTTNASRSIASAESESCKRVTEAEFNAIHSACPLISKKEIIEEQQKCYRSLEGQSESCKERVANLNSRIYTLKLNLDRYHAAKENDDEEYDPFTREGVNTAAKNYSLIDDILDEIERISRSDHCSPISSLYSILPLISKFQPESSFVIGASLDVGSRLVRLMKAEEMSFADKKKLCEANKKMKQARSITCQKMVLSDPKIKEGLQNTIDEYQKFSEIGKKSKTHEFVIQMGELCKSIKQSKVNLDEIEESRAEDFSYKGYQDLLIFQKSQLNCKWEKAKELCDDFDIAIERATPNNLHWNSPTSSRDLGLLARFACSDFNYMIHGMGVVRKNRRESYNKLYENEFKDEIFPLFGEPHGVAYHGLQTSDKSDSWDVGIADYQALLEAVRTDFSGSVDAVTKAIEMIPKTVKRNKTSRENYCKAVSCFWAQAKTGNEQEPKELEGIKNFSSNGAIPVNPLTLDDYHTMGKSYDIGWKERVNFKKSKLNYFIKTCARQESLSCDLDCKVPGDSEDRNEIESAAGTGPATKASTSDR